ncbi:MAG: FAD-binding oxidoreductase [Rhizobiaceae bacterium]|nr:FAD-binding oxidoreductase [Rhizobiaceae bacterium]
MQIETLRAAMRGTLIVHDEASYDHARKGLLFNGSKPDRHPVLIVRAADVKDVQTVVRFAAAEGLAVSVRGSGHNWSGIALQDGIVLDVSALDTVSIDAAARIAEVGPGATNRTVARILTENGFAFPLGHCGTVALSGYLLGGGFGWNSGAWGMAAFSVESVDVVTADGMLRHASESENADIFWAARGAGPAFFGVVTGYRLRLQPLPRAITTSVWTYSLDRIAEVERWMTGAMRTGPANVEFTAAMTSAPPPLAGAGKVVSAIATVFADNDTDAGDVLAAIAASAPNGALDIQQGMPTPFDTLYDIIAQFFPEGARYAVDSFWSNEPDSLLGSLAAGVAASPSPMSFALGVVMPPDRPSAPAAALSVTGRAFAAAYAIWTDPSDDERHRAWLRATADTAAPVTLGHYVGEADLDRPGRMAGCFSPAAWNRLCALRQWHDPAGLFAGETRKRASRAA